MEIQIADHRPALTLAIHLAKEDGEPLLPQWEEEMTKMVAEVTRKFFGALTKATVRKGLDATVGILSLGLLHATSGAIEPETWLLKLRSGGIKGISKQGIDLVKECAALPEGDFVFSESAGTGASARDLLLLCVKKGYPYLMAKMAERRANGRAIRLAHWMLENSTVGRVVKKNLEETIGECAMADDVFFYVLARECAIPAERLPENDERLVRLPPNLRKAAKKRYDEFVARIPQELRSALYYNGENWFDRSIEPSGRK